MFGWFRRPSNDRVIDRLYLAIVSGARMPELYATYGVPDTFEGRFESLTLHAVLVLRRLQACAAPGPEMAQHLVDTIFRHFDRTLREMGVGDTVVPKRMKSLAEAFLGRSTAYEAAFREGHAALVDVIARNVLGARGIAGDQAHADALAAYTLACDAHLQQLELQAFVDGAVTFPLRERMAA